MIERYSFPEMLGIWQEENKFRIMLEIEVLACEAYSRFGCVPKEAVQRIRAKAKFDLKQIKKIEEKTQHDVVAFVTNVSRYIGSDAQYLHLGLTSSDLLDTTLNAQLKQAADILLTDLEQLQKILAKTARKYRDTVCIGRTHGVHAEPMTFGLKFALWFEEIKRNIIRMRQAKEVICCGKLSGAVGTYSNISPQVEVYICKKLGLKPVNIATQIIQRDIYAEYLSVLAIIAASLEKFALEIRHLQRTEVLEAEEPFAKDQKGSSAMPHKRNPVVCERICGLARVLRSNALAGLENVALWHERDISHSSVERIILPDSTILLDYMLRKFITVVDGLLVYPENMLANLLKTKGLIFSQRALLVLMDKGLSRPKAYDLVQRCAMLTWKGGSKDFKTNLLEDPQVKKLLTAKDLGRIFDLNFYLRHVDLIFRKTGLGGK